MEPSRSPTTGSYSVSTARRHLQTPLRLHIKNNRSGEDVFRITESRWRAARRRHPDTAARLRATIDWDLDRFDASMATAHALVTWDLPTADLARRAPKLKLVHVIGAGVEHLAPFDWLPPGVALTNNRGVHAQKAGEYVTMALLMLNADLPRYATDQHNRRWDPAFSTPIAGKTLLVVGAGHMGRAGARAARKLGLRVHGIRRSGRSARGFDAMGGPERLRHWLPVADFVLVTAPLTAETAGLLGADELAAMKPDAGLINMGRAAVVDYGALCERLSSGRLRGAVLDVFDPEPLPHASPLWRTPNLLITPHVSSDDDESYIPLTLDLVLENIGRLIAGRPLKNRVNPMLGY